MVLSIYDKYENEDIYLKSKHFVHNPNPDLNPKPDFTLNLT